MGMSTTQKSSSESWSYRTAERDHVQPNMSSYSSKSYSSSSTTNPRTGKVALDEQAQLDKILSDLLDDKAFVTREKTATGQNVNMKFKEDLVSPEGSIVTQRGDIMFKVPAEVRQEKHIAMKSESKTVSSSTEDKSYKPVNAFTYTPSSPEMSRSFEPIKSPGSPKVGSLPYKTDYENRYKKEYSYQSNGPSSMSDGESLSWLQQQQAKLRERSTERDPSSVQNERMMLEELRTAQTHNKFFQKQSKTEEETVTPKSASSVQSGPSQNGPSGYSYTVSRTHTYNADKSGRPTSPPITASHTTYITEQSTAGSKLSNKPPPSPGLQRTVTPTLSAPVPPPQRTSSKDYMHQQQTQQTQQQQQSRNRTFSGGNAYQTSSSNSWKTESHQPRSMQRTHSETVYDREVERQNAPRSYITPPISPRSVSPQTYQSYKTVYKTIHHKDEPDFDKPVEVKIEKQMQQSQQSQQKVQTEQQKPHYITEVIVQRTGGADSKASTLNRSELEKKETDNRLEALEKTLQAAQNSIIQTAPWQQQQQQQQQVVQQEETRRYETRTYETKSEHREERQQQERVSRRDGHMTNGGYPRSMSPGWDNVPIVEHVQQTQNEPLPPPKKLEVTEEDRITLRPIGPGVHQLEPEGSHTGTLSRDGSSTLGRTTPSFPTSPSASAGGHVITPGGTLSSDKMQYSQLASQQYQTQTLPHGSTQASQPFQTSTLPHGATQVSQPFQTSTLPHQSSYNQQQQQQQQQQSYQKQSYQSSSSSSNQQWSSSSQQHGGLHVDTNQPRMMLQNARSPSSPGSPPSPGNLNTLRQQLHIAHNMSGNAISPGPHSATGQSSPSVYFGLSRRGSLTSLADSEAVTNTPKFVKDTSKFWYKPNITREEAIMLLKDRQPGTFVVRDSNSFPGAFGLALKVATLPPNVQTKSTGDPMADLVRHFLIEPTSKGVRLRGCSNEPVFGSLASLVYQHSITPLALPCKLVLPEHDPTSLSMDMSPTTEAPSSASALLAQGAACNVVFLNTVDTESLTGPQAVARACKVTFDLPPQKTTAVHFKVSNQGITLTDNQRKLFFRRHYPVAAVTYCGMDPEDRKWRRPGDVPGTEIEAKVFGFVARKQGSISDNACHLFAELDPDQPASAIVNFVTKIMIGQGKIKS